jgi:hypothetical protein
MPFLCLVAKKWRKKRRSDVPSEASLSLPLCKENRGEKYIRFHCIARRKANTSGRRKKQNILLKWGADNKSKFFYRRALRATSVFASFFNLQTQRLKI